MLTGVVFPLMLLIRLLLAFWLVLLLAGVVGVAGGSLRLLEELALEAAVFCAESLTFVVFIRLRSLLIDMR